MVVNMLYNLSDIYSSHHRIVKYVGFKPIHYAINLNVTSSSKVFRELIMCFYLIYYYSPLKKTVFKIVFAS